jgi:hypothetical protein
MITTWYDSHATPLYVISISLENMYIRETTELGQFMCYSHCIRTGYREFDSRCRQELLYSYFLPCPGMSHSQPPVRWIVDALPAAFNQPQRGAVPVLPHRFPHYGTVSTVEIPHECSHIYFSWFSVL